MPMIDQREPAVVSPDDLMAELARQYGDVQLAAYASLARSRGLPMREVLALACEGRLAQAIDLPVVSAPIEEDDPGD
jgi:hypothetical protein